MIETVQDGQRSIALHNDNIDSNDNAKQNIKRGKNKTFVYLGKNSLIVFFNVLLCDLIFFIWAQEINIKGSKIHNRQKV